MVKDSLAKTVVGLDGTGGWGFPGVVEAITDDGCSIKFRSSIGGHAGSLDLSWTPGFSLVDLSCVSCGPLVRLLLTFRGPPVRLLWTRRGPLVRLL